MVGRKGSHAGRLHEVQMAVDWRWVFLRCELPQDEAIRSAIRTEQDLVSLLCVLRESLVNAWLRRLRCAGLARCERHKTRPAAFHSILA